MTDSSADFAVGHRVRVHPGSDDERFGIIVADFGDSAGLGVTVGDSQIAEPSRRWAIQLDDGALVFIDGAELTAGQ